jgi:transcription regulator MmyB-like protein
MVGHRGDDAVAAGRAYIQHPDPLRVDLDALPATERNLIRLTFLDETIRSRYADWQRAARECVAVLRMESGRIPH